MRFPAAAPAISSTSIPDDPERVATFNVLANVPRDRIAPTTSEIVAACKAVWDSWGPRMERILYNAIAGAH